MKLPPLLNSRPIRRQLPFLKCPRISGLYADIVQIANKNTERELVGVFIVHTMVRSGRIQTQLETRIRRHARPLFLDKTDEALATSFPNKTV